MRIVPRLFLLVALASCSDPTGAKPRGDPFTIIVPHIHFADTLAQHYDLILFVDDAGPPPPTPSNLGGVDSSQVATGFTSCFSLQTDSLGARLLWAELRSSAPAPVGDTLRSVTFDPANIPSPDSAAGYGQTYDRPYFWHWYIANDSNVIRGDTTPVVLGNQVCSF